MSIFAQGSRTKLGFVIESVPGTTPGSPVFIDIPFQSHSLDLQKKMIESTTIRSDRKIPFVIPGNSHVAGDIKFELKSTDFDHLLESAFVNQFDSTSTLKDGVVRTFVSIQESQVDLPQYRVFSGMEVNQLMIDIKPDAIVTGTMSFIGEAQSAWSGSATGVVTAPTTTQPFNSFQGTIKEGGTTIATITAMQFTINNGMNPNFVIGSSTPPQVEIMQAKVTGSVDAYVSDMSLYNKFINNTATSLEMSLTDGSKTYDFKFPNVIYTDAKMPVKDMKARVVSMKFDAILDATTQAQIILIKS